MTGETTGATGAMTGATGAMAAGMTGVTGAMTGKTVGGAGLDCSGNRELDDGLRQVTLTIAPVIGLDGPRPLPTWRPRSGMTSRPRLKNSAITDGSSAGHVRLPAGGRRNGQIW